MAIYDIYCFVFHLKHILTYVFLTYVTPKVILATAPKFSPMWLSSYYFFRPNTFLT